MTSNSKKIEKIVLFTLLTLFLLSTSVFSKSLQVHFIDVGQGDCIFIITPNQKTILIDAGIHSGEDHKRNPFNYIRIFYDRLQWDY